MTDRERADLAERRLAELKARLMDLADRWDGYEHDRPGALVHAYIVSAAIRETVREGGRP